MQEESLVHGCCSTLERNNTDESPSPSVPQGSVSALLKSSQGIDSPCCVWLLIQAEKEEQAEFGRATLPFAPLPVQT